QIYTLSLHDALPIYLLVLIDHPRHRAELLGASARIRATKAGRREHRVSERIDVARSGEASARPVDDFGDRATVERGDRGSTGERDRKSTRLNSSHVK